MNFMRRLIFNFWYFFEPPWDTNITPPELIDFIEKHPPGRALDLGCGTGTNVITLAQHGWEATGVDFAAKAIRAARRKARQAAIQAEFLAQEVTQLDNLVEPFDLILDIGCLHSIASQGQSDYIKNLDRLLKPGGSYLLYVFSALAIISCGMVIPIRSAAAVFTERLITLPFSTAILEASSPLSILTTISPVW